MSKLRAQSFLGHTIMSGLSITIDASQTTAVGIQPFPAPSSAVASSSPPAHATSKMSSRARVAEAAQERLWTELTSLYSDNRELESKATKSTSRDKDGSAGDDIASTLDSLLETFLNGADIVLNELSTLGNAHPVLAVAIFAFHEVIKLDIARRENNKKVLVVIMQMQSMMGPMFQLRDLDHNNMPPEKRAFHESRLKQLADLITQNIKECRSDISHFMNRKFMLKLVLAKGYERKFATHMEIFALRRSELQAIISEYLAVGMSSASVALADVGKKLDIVDEKLDKIVSRLFRNLDTQRERDVFKFMQINGGPEKCINDLDLLPKLISKAGEMAGTSAVYDQKGLEELQKQLREALAEDLDKVLEKHYSRFEKILQVQNNNLKSMSMSLEDQGVLMQVHATKLGKILDTVTTIMVMEEGKVQTRAVKLKDPEIQRVWDRMNLTSSSVKAKVFVLTFRDHIRVDNSTAGTPTSTKATLPDDRAGGDLLQASGRDAGDKESDEWVMDYIDVAYVQPIVEAMDEDGSGFISVKEANSFALSRPKGLSLLHWIAYWAAGWHINLDNFKKEVYSLLLEIYELLPSIHVANRKLVDDYLDDNSLRRVEALLRSIKPLPDNGRKEPKLVEVANVVATSQLERLEKNLNEMGYSIESAADAATIGGSFRVETWILPLILLLIRRHLKIVQLARTVVLDTTEFDTHTASLSSVFAVFDKRMDNVQAKLRQLHSNVNAQFENFAYGMFLAAFKNTELNTSENSLLAFRSYEDYRRGSPPSISGQIPDSSFLSKPVGEAFEYDEVLQDVTTKGSEVPACIPINGLWLTLTIDNESGWKDPYLFRLQPVGDRSFTANCQAYYKTFDVEVRVSEAAEGRPEVTFDMPHLSQTFKGLYDPDRDVIEGAFGNAPTKPAEQAQDTPEAAEAGEVRVQSEGQIPPLPDNEESQVWLGKFYMRRTPPDVFRFRSLLDGPGPVPCWSVWPIARKRWAFAIEAVLYRVRLRIGSRKTTLTVLAERRKWLTYAQRWYLTDQDTWDRWSLYEPLTGTQWEEYKAMLWTMDPTIARLYEKLGLYFMRRGKWNVGWWYCDACSKTLSFTRYQCIVCMEDDLSHTIDLCDLCFNKPDVVHGAGNLTHLPSHSLLRSRRPIHNFEVKTLIAESRLTSERSKRIFRDQERKAKEAKEPKSKRALKGRTARKQIAVIESDENVVNVPVQICACCSKPVTPPCWVCTSCFPLTFICDDCDRKSFPVVLPGRNHSNVEHHLLRIHDSIEVKPVKTSDMERQLDQINTNISAMEEKFKSQLEEVKVVVEEVAKTMGVEDFEDNITELTNEDPLDITAHFADAEKEIKGQNGTSVLEQETEESGNPSPKSGEEERDPSSKNHGKPSSQMDLMGRISLLETKVENMHRNSDAFGQRFDALEAKIDRQFEVLFAQMQRLLPPQVPE